MVNECHSNFYIYSQNFIVRLLQTLIRCVFWELQFLNQNKCKYKLDKGTEIRMLCVNVPRKSNCFFFFIRIGSVMIFSSPFKPLRFSVNELAYFDCVTIQTNYMFLRIYRKSWKCLHLNGN